MTRSCSIGSCGIRLSWTRVAGSLTLGKREILDLIAEGCTNLQILGSGYSWQRPHQELRFSGRPTKLGMQRRTQAAVYGATLRQRTEG